MPWAPASQGFPRGPERTYSMAQQGTHSSARPSPAQHSLLGAGTVRPPRARGHTAFLVLCVILPVGAPRLSLHPSALVPESVDSFLPGVRACVPYPKAVPVCALCGSQACLPACLRGCARVCVCACVVRRVCHTVPIAHIYSVPRTGSAPPSRPAVIRGTMTG